MITLVAFPAMFGTRSSSPFSIKAEYLLNMAGVTWTRQDEGYPRKWPKGKLPAIVIEARVVGGSDGIQKYLEDQGHGLHKGLSEIDSQRTYFCPYGRGTHVLSFGAGPLG